MSKTVRKAVIPVAGLGTRFLPMTKVVPKELLPIVDKPAIQYVIEEAVNSGIETIILVISRGKESIQTYFTHAPEYEKQLTKMGKLYLLEDLNKLIDKFNIEITYQDEPKGLGHAVHCAKGAVGNEPFILILPDVIVESEPPCSKQLIDVYNRTGHGVIYTEHTPRERLGAYGVLNLEGNVGPLHKIKGLVEKPNPDEAPSDLIVVGRYLLPASIFSMIERTKSGHGGEIQITDALTQLAQTEGLYAFEHPATVFDTGDKLGYMKACLYFGMKHEKLGSELKEEIIRLADE